jgi:hypothetical protein
MKDQDGAARSRKALPGRTKVPTEDAALVLTLTRSLEKKRYAAFAFAQSWKAKGMLSHVASWQPNTSLLNHDAF